MKLLQCPSESVIRDIGNSRELKLEFAVRKYFACSHIDSLSPNITGVGDPQGDRYGTLMKLSIESMNKI